MRPSLVIGIILAVPLGIVAALAQRGLEIHWDRYLAFVVLSLALVIWGSRAED